MPKIIAAAISAVIIGAAILSLVRVYGVAQFTLRAESAQGIVVDFVQRRRIGPKFQGTVNIPVVEYHTALGEIVRFQALGAGKRDNFGKGQRVSVLYRPDHPEVARIDSFSHLWLSPLGFAAVAVPFGGTILFIWLRMWARLRRKKWLQQHGRVIQAKFVGVETGISRRLDRPFRHLVAEWKDPLDGTTYRFKSELFWFDPSSYVRAKTITVEIDPKNPNRHMMDLSFIPK